MPKDQISFSKKRAASSKHSDYTDDETENYAAEVSDEEVEKAQDRLKQAKKYLADLSRDAKKNKKTGDDSSDGEESLPFGEIDAEEIDKEIIASRLQRDTLISRGRAFENIAESFKDLDFHKIHCNTPDGKVPTGCVFGPEDSGIVYLITKGNCVYQYHVVDSGDNPALRKLHTFRGIGQASDIDTFCSLAISSCGGYLVVGSRSGKIVVWSVKKNSTGTSYTYKQLTVLSQHRGPVLDLSFSRDDLTFYSASSDRTIKIWSLESGEALYIDTLYGHQDSVPSLSALGKETCVSVGSRDRTARLWKVSEETQLVFRGPESSGGSQEIISMIEEGAFVTGTDLGSISLWNTRRKKPLCTQLQAHTGNKPIGALAAYPFTDLLASGSGDGFLRLWRAAPSANELTCLREIPLEGFINCAAWSGNGKALAVVVGKEQRLGRWELQKSAKNQLHIYFFNKN
jgi:ribosomal RNA-processing protein 9